MQKLADEIISFFKLISLFLDNFAYHDAEEERKSIFLELVVAKDLHWYGPKLNANPLLIELFLDYKLIETESKYKTALAQELNSASYSLVVLGLSSKIARRIQVINENLPIMAVMDVEVMLRKKMDQVAEEHRDLILTGDGSDEISIKIERLES